jgi:hypothetical protein
MTNLYKSMLNSSKYKFFGRTYWTELELPLLAIGISIDTFTK